MAVGERHRKGGGARTDETPATSLGARSRGGEAAITPNRRRRKQMSPLARSRNIAARMGRWSASHKKTAIFGWLAFVAAAFMIGNVLGTKQLDPDKAGSGESGHVNAVLSDEFKQPIGDTVLIQSTSKTAGDPAFRAAIDNVSYTLANLKSVKRVESPLERGNEGQ